MSRGRVAAARDVQSARFNGHGVRTNAEADGELLDRIATPDEPGKKLLADAALAMRLSARGFHRVMRVARTIADLAGQRRGRADPYRRSAQLPPTTAEELAAYCHWLASMNARLTARCNGARTG